MTQNAYQKHYESKAGSASINIKKAQAGESVNCLLTYTAGELGIDNSGSLKVLFRLASDAAEFQFSNKKGANYAEVSVSNKNVRVDIDSRSEGTKGKMGLRPWSRGFRVIFTGSDIKKNDKVSIKFYNWRVQTFCEYGHQFKLLIDPFATDRFIELPNNPKIDIVNGEPYRIIVNAPTIVRKGEKYSALVKVEDRWGNPCYSVDGSVKISVDAGISCQPRASLKKGKAKVSLKPEAPRSLILFLRAQFKSLKGVSNPVLVKEKEDTLNHYWAELHAQSEETVGTNSIDSYFAFARDYAFVDILSHQGNDFQITNEFWEKINKISSEYNQDGSFVAFPGYEWSGNTAKGGDRNVIYLKENEPIHRSSHALLDSFNDIEKDIPSAKELLKKMKSRKALMMAHVGGRYADLRVHDDVPERLVEVHSCWGTFEWFLFEALRRNYIVGVTANSDGHDGRPGAAYPGASHFSNKGGLTCVLAESLDRESVFQALYNRRCYATTGARIFLDAYIEMENKKKAVMGDLVSLKRSADGANYELKGNVVGTTPVERMEIYKKDKCIRTLFPFADNTDSPERYIKIAWKGAASCGRDRNKKWKGHLKLKGGDLSDKDIETVNFLNSKSQYKLLNKKELSWEAETSGNNQALILSVSRKNTHKKALEVILNKKTFTLSLNNITAKSYKYKFSGVDSAVEVHETTDSTKPEYVEFCEKVGKLEKGLNPVFIKVIQRDGHAAWSSPIYLKRK